MGTAPGARVTVAGPWGQVEVLASEEGVFEARIPLGEETTKSSSPRWIRWAES